MKVTLNIENDAELRAYVKDLISGQVKSILREEIAEIIKTVVHGKIKNSGVEVPNIEHIMKRQIEEAVSKQLNSTGYTDPGFIKSEARKIINSYINNALNKGTV